MKIMKIEELRANIDQIDREIQTLFEKRMKTAAEIGKQKQENHLPVCQPDRERELLYHISERASDDLQTYTKVLYSTLIQLSRAYQQELFHRESTSFTKDFDSALENVIPQFPSRAVVACQGTEGAYSQIAADQLFKTPSIMYFGSFESVCAAVDSGLCEYGVLPIENSTAGSVNQVYDLMSDHHFCIVRSIRVHVQHNLLAKPQTKLCDIKNVYSHSQALSQCSEFLESHGFEQHKMANTALAAKRVSESNEPGDVAIASSECASLYGLTPVARSIQNSDYNETRFICISKTMKFFEGANRTSIRMRLKNKPGALYEILSKFWVRDINLVKLESRPIPGSNFEFVFYFDIEEPLHSVALRELLHELESNDDFWYFGTYTEC